MLHSLKRTFLIAASTAFLVVTPLVSVHAIGIELKPVRYEKTVQPGETIEVPLKILNKGSAFTASFEAATFTYSDDSGTPKIVAPENRRVGYDIQDWISLPDQIDVEENVEVEVAYTVSIPEDARPGGHYGTVFVLQELGRDDDGAVGMVAKVGALIILKVDGDIVEEAELTGFDIAEQSEEAGNLDFEVFIKNSGNVHVVPYGKIEIKDSEGNIVQGIDVESVVDGKGTQTGIRAIDYIRFNADKKIILPGQIRSLKASWKKPPVGEYSAQLLLKYEGNEEGVSSEEISFQVHENAQIENLTKNKQDVSQKLYFALALVFILGIVGYTVRKK